MDFIWILFAFVCGMAVKIVSLPPLIGYLIAGFILHAIGIEPATHLEVLADLGITLMLFTIGLKLEIKDLYKREVWLSSISHSVLWISLISTTFLGLSLLPIPLFESIDKTSAATLAFALSFSSTVCVIKLLQDTHELTTRHGRIAVGILVIQDIIAVLFLISVTGKVPAPEALLLLGLWWLRPSINKLLTYAGHSELLPLAGFFLALGSYELFEFVGIKGDLGALVMGFLITGSPKSAELSKALLGFKELFLIGFFLSIGFEALPTWSMFFTALVLSSVLLIKAGLFYIIFYFIGLRARTSFLSSLLLSNFSEFGLIVLDLASEEKLISKEWLVIAALATAISFIISSVLYPSAHKYFTRWKKQLKVLEKKKRLKEDVYLQPKNAEILIVGMGRVGRGTYKAIHQLNDEQVAGIDANRDRVRAQKKLGFNVFTGDGEDSDLWESMDLSPIKLILLTLPSTRDSKNVTMRLRQAGYTKKIAAVTRYEDEKKILLNAGIDTVFNFYDEVGSGFAEESLELIKFN
jgi:predicted Kef-type K+ transport protein